MLLFVQFMVDILKNQYNKTGMRQEFICHAVIKYPITHYTLSTGMAAS